MAGSITAGCFIAACADIFGIHNAGTDASVGDGGGGDVVIDAPYDYNVFDAVEFDVNTAVCGDGGVPFVDAGDAVWVSGGGNDSAQCGTQATPCKTIAQALTNRGARNVVYLDDSTFNEVVTLASAQSGVTVQGGWVIGDAGWTPVCNNTSSIIQGPDDAGSAAVEVTTDNVTLRLMTVKSKTQGAQGASVPVPESVYAVRATNAPNLTLDNVTLIAQNAGGGQQGTTSTTVVGCSPTSGNGQTGSIGGAGAQGTFSVPAPNFNVTAGGAGTPGAAGSYTGPGPGQCNPNCNKAPQCP